MGKSWENRGKIMRKSWENHGKIMGKSWENLGKIVGKSWENHGKIMGKSCSPAENRVPFPQVTRLRVAMAAFESPDGCGIEGVAPWTPMVMVPYGISIGFCWGKCCVFTVFLW